MTGTKQSFAWILGALALQACAPLTSGTNNSVSGNCFGVSQNSGGVGIGQTNGPNPGGFTNISTNQLAQSFKAQSSSSFTTASLNLNSFYTTTGATINGELQVDIEQDATTYINGNGTPSSPGGTSTSLGTAVLNISSTNPPTVAQGGPTFITFTFPTAISLTVNQIYWVVATPPGASSTQYIEWRYSNTSLANQVAQYFSTVSSTWISLGTNINLDFKIGC